jgi:ABC-type lipopolysaccharide export system ATPase subunit
MKILQDPIHRTPVCKFAFSHLKMQYNNEISTLLNEYDLTHLYSDSAVNLNGGRDICR